jgi:hypothetical protein
VAEALCVLVAEGVVGFVVLDDIVEAEVQGLEG